MNAVLGSPTRSAADQISLAAQSCTVCVCDWVHLIRAHCTCSMNSSFQNGRPRILILLSLAQLERKIFTTSKSSNHWLFWLLIVVVLFCVRMGRSMSTWHSQLAGKS
jgi:hypothetical protein